MKSKRATEWNVADRDYEKNARAAARKGARVRAELSAFLEQQPGQAVPAKLVAGFLAHVDAVGVLPTPKLAPELKLAPQLLVPKDKAARDDEREREFFLGLAVAFNDLKDVQLLLQWLEGWRPAEATPLSVIHGEWNGVQSHAMRMTVAIVHEVLNLLAAKKYKPVLESEKLRSIVAAQHKTAQRAWKELLDQAQGSSNSNLGRLMAAVRSATYHYYEPATFTRGFRAHFYEQPKGDGTAHAWASLGDRMEGTRFYYADAAAFGVLLKSATTKGVTAPFDRIRALAQEVNHALGPILISYLRSLASTE